MSEAAEPLSVDWICEGRLGAMPLPSVGELERLKAMGVGLVVTLTEEWYNPAVFRAVGLRSVHIPVEDTRAPSLAQMRDFVAEVDAAFARGRRSWSIAWVAWAGPAP